MPYKCDRECFNKNEDGWCKDEWCRNPIPTLPYGAVYKHTDYAEEVYDKYTDTAGNIHCTGTHSGKHIIPAEGGRGMKDYPPYLDYPKECKPQTNADRIRAMTNEELAEAFVAITSPKRPSTYTAEGFCLDDGEMSEMDWLDWLKSPVADGGWE